MKNEFFILIDSEREIPIGGEHQNETRFKTGTQGSGGWQAQKRNLRQGYSLLWSGLFSLPLDI